MSFHTHVRGCHGGAGPRRRGRQSDVRAAAADVLADERLQQPVRVVRLVEAERGGRPDARGDRRAWRRALPALGTRLVVFSGGEPLLRPEVFNAAELFRAEGARLHLLTSGVLLERRADGVARAFERVVVSLDATSRALYGAVRGVAALGTVEAGVARLRRLAPEVVVTARVDAAPPELPRAARAHRSREEPRPRRHLVPCGRRRLHGLRADGGARRGVGPAADARGGRRVRRARRAHDRRARRGLRVGVRRRVGGEAAAAAAALPRGDRRRAVSRPACDAPWVSAVVEANGDVRPCFFHAVIGNVREHPLAGSSRSTCPRSAARSTCGPTPRAGAACARSRRAGGARRGSERARARRHPARVRRRRRATTRARTPSNPLLRAMRARALAALTSHVPDGSHVLDLGCGPGTDDETLGRAGYRVTGVDWSPAMVAEAARRIREARLDGAVAIRHLGIHEIDRLAPTLVRRRVLRTSDRSTACRVSTGAARLIADRLRPGGMLVASVIGRVCPWEVALLPVARRLAPRHRPVRPRSAVPVPLNGRTVWTRYYSPAPFERAFADAGFTRVSLRALGLFAPPPYLEAFAARHPVPGRSPAATRRPARRADAVPRAGAITSSS